MNKIVIDNNLVVGSRMDQSRYDTRWNSRSSILRNNKYLGGGFSGT
jgi:hypothetical protein